LKKRLYVGTKNFFSITVKQTTWQALKMGFLWRMACAPTENYRLQEYYQMDPNQRPTHFMIGTANEVWGNDTHEVIFATVADWKD
jgi:hypothetical protein